MFPSGGAAEASRRDGRGGLHSSLVRPRSPPRFALAAIALLSVAATPMRPTGLKEPRFLPCYAPRPEARVAGKRGDLAALRDRTAAWPTLDLEDGATNTGIPEALVVNARAPVDVATLAAEPLRGDAADLARIHGLLRAARERVVRIAVWGDSHTVGDVLTGQIRRKLQARYGDVGPGFVFPFGVVGTTPVGRASACEHGDWAVAAQVGRKPGEWLGPAGLAATGRTTTDEVTVVVEDEARKGAVQSVSLLAFDQPGGGTLSIVVDDGDPMTIPTAGSPAPRLVSIELPLGPHTVVLRPQGDGPVRVGGLAFDRPSMTGGGVSVDGLGSGGRRLTAWETWDTGTMRAWVATRPYDLVIMSAGSADGTNVELTEDEFRASARASLTRFREMVPDAACVILGPADRALRVDTTHVTVWMNHAMINRVLREEAPAAHCVTWDLQAAFGGAGHAVALNRAGLVQDDLLHFTPAGLRLAGEQLVTLLDPR